LNYLVNNCRGPINRAHKYIPRSIFKPSSLSIYPKGNWSANRIGKECDARNKLRRCNSWVSSNFQSPRSTVPGYPNL